MANLLLVEDDEGLAALLTELLEIEGYTLLRAADGEEGLELAQKQDVDLIILDIMLPRKNGFDLLRELRQDKATPVIMLTARGDEVDRIVGLEMGADDYLPKPCSPRLLLASIRALLRRVELERSVPGENVSLGNNQMRAGALQINSKSRQVKIGEEILALTGTEYSLLLELLAHPDELLSRDALSRAVLHKRLQPYDRSLDMHISNLRKKLGESDGIPRISTVRGQGYLLSLPEAG
ncbi:response regulator [Pokkaliibacter sp. CJK22405]|uniref:response regulator n=1 Tax=Pokkaliibacter sp. CJK22405 TaxID=3384615 RepID=UPI0039851227